MSRGELNLCADEIFFNHRLQKHLPTLVWRFHTHTVLVPARFSGLRTLARPRSDWTKPMSPGEGATSDYLIITWSAG